MMMVQAFKFVRDSFQVFEVNKTLKESSNKYVSTSTQAVLFY
jgi:hypothetical protein